MLTHVSCIEGGYRELWGFEVIGQASAGDSFNGSRVYECLLLKKSPAPFKSAACHEIIAFRQL